MKLSFKIIFFTLLCAAFAKAQVGIGTNDPKGALHISSSQNLGVVLPSVSDLTTVTDGNGNPPVNGTMVFNTDLMMTCVFADAKWSCFGIDSSGNPVVIDGTPIVPGDFTYDTRQTYVKSSTPAAMSASFGHGVDLSDDGNTLAIAARWDQAFIGYGVVFIYERTSTGWVEQAVLQPTIKTNPDYFGYYFDLSDDGNTIGIASIYENSGVVGDPNDTSIPRAGAAYIFRRSGTTWTQQAYLKQPIPKSQVYFGSVIVLSADGNRAAIGVPYDNSNAAIINGNQADTSMQQSGSVFIFDFNGTNWSATTYIKPSNPSLGDRFGNQIAISADGSIIAINAMSEDGTLPGINPTRDDAGNNTGAVYIFRETAGIWVEEAYIHSPAPTDSYTYGKSLDLSADGNTLIVGDEFESFNGTGVNSANTGTSGQSGAAHLYTYDGSNWLYDTLFKAPENGSGDRFGHGVAISSDGNVVMMSAPYEDSDAVGINGDMTNNNITDAGAGYVYSKQAGTWSFQSYVKAFSNTSATRLGNDFAFTAWSSHSALSLNSDGSVMVIATDMEDSNATTINGNQLDTSTFRNGAAWIYEDN